MNRMQKRELVEQQRKILKPGRNVLTSEPNILSLLDLTFVLPCPASCRLLIQLPFSLAGSRRGRERRSRSGSRGVTCGKQRFIGD
jgi:hypothetical protein